MDTVTLEQIIGNLPPIRTIGNLRSGVSTLKSIDDKKFDSATIGWCADKNIYLLETIHQGTVIISENAFDKVIQHPAVNYIVVANPRYYFLKVIQEFFNPDLQKQGLISASAIISGDVVLDKSTVFIGEYVVIEKNVRIGKRVMIDHHTIIKANTVIGDDVKIGCHNTIGGIGFGYEKNEKGLYEGIPHIGNVVLKNGVETGNNTCIDRAVLGSTLLHENVKLDNLVHIAHGVEIGQNTLVTANVMIAGSTKIGSNCWIAPSASVINKTSIGNDVFVGIGSVVVKPAEDNTRIGGFPARPLR